MLDRGLFDAAGWFEFLCNTQKRLSAEDREIITRFFTLELWRKRENGVFLFTSDRATSLKREQHDKLTTRGGSVMNAEILKGLRASYEAVAGRHSHEFPHLYHVDTSFVNGEPPSFQQIAFCVAEKMTHIMEEASTQMLLVTEPVAFRGFERARDVMEKTIKSILNDNRPRFLDRAEAEKTLDVQQVVPYAVLQREDGTYFWARRRSNVRRKELQGKHTILVGGHAEKRDWDAGSPRDVFTQCLRRELEEELVGVQILDIEPLGFLHDPRSTMGEHHLAFVHRIRVGGQTGIRRQAIDQEFGRESVSWKNPEEIKDAAKQLDPWSQFVAHGLFDAPSPKGEPLLFSDPES
ncbi:MAG: NUDIX domain-containing protein [Phycisphaerales bacterium]|nr:MAG: NUDIX domain-containing protein [Phycisphaerales bacterium]